ncbi:MAG: hypothetical protein JRJ12_01305 [Deltaproteobacteria bacterium]|nr:hypothetical protein [Deltaproteobacteria bacterium]MBW2072457.1 hypothetical protein [Deltaproteobacteria bacterium]
MPKRDISNISHFFLSEQSKRSGDTVRQTLAHFEYEGVKNPAKRSGRERIFRAHLVRLERMLKAVDDTPESEHITRQEEGSDKSPSAASTAPAACFSLEDFLPEMPDRKGD